MLLQSFVNCELIHPIIITVLLRIITSLVRYLADVNRQIGRRDDAVTVVAS